MNPMMGGMGMGMPGMPMGGNLATNIPPSSGLLNQPVASGPGPKIESFQRDGFNILGK